MSSPAASPETEYRENPGFLVRGFRGQDQIAPILLGGLRETLYAIAEPSRGNDPVPFAWIGQCNLVIGQPDRFAIEDLIDFASYIDGVPHPVTYETAPDSIMGEFMVAEGGAIRRIVAGDQLAREWSDDAGAVGSFLRLLGILKRETCLMRETQIDWRWRPDGAVRNRLMYLGTAEMML